MKRVFPLLLLSGLLCSCRITHRHVWEYAYKHDGIVVDSPGTCYLHGGRRYVRGFRAQFREFPTSMHLDPIKGNVYQWSEIPGTRGAMVYHEVQHCNDAVSGGKFAKLKEDAAWHSLVGAPTRSSPISTYFYNEYQVDKSTRRLSTNAWYVLPAVPFVFVADAVVSVAALPIGSVAFICKAPFRATQQQAAEQKAPQPTTNP